MMARNRREYTTIISVFMLAIALAFALGATPSIAFADEAGDEQQQVADVPEGDGGAEEGEDCQEDQVVPGDGQQAPSEGQPVDDGQQPADDGQQPADDGQQPAEDGQQPAEDEDPVLEPAAPDTDANRTIADGTYIIDAAIANAQVVDVVAGSTARGVNVQTYAFNGSDAQKWDFKYEEASQAYIIGLYGTNFARVLNVAGGLDANKANVQTWEFIEWSDSGEAARQRWLLTQRGDGSWSIASLLNPSRVLDIAAGKKENKTNIQIYDSNDTAAQKFYLVLADDEPAGDPIVTDGVYAFASAINKKFVLDVKAASTANNANVQIYTNNKSAAQKWQVVLGGDGYYTIVSIVSGKLLTVAKNEFVSGVNVHQAARVGSGSSMQKWVAVRNADGTLSFINKATHHALDIDWGKMANGTNVQGIRRKLVAAQKWDLVSANYIESGIYEIKPLSNDSYNLDIAAASNQSGAAAQVYTDNDSLAQRFQVVSLGSNRYKIRTAASGGWLTDNGAGKPVIQNGSSKTEASADVWEGFWNGNYFSLRNTRTNRVLDLTGNPADKVRTHANAANNRPTQHFRFVPAQLLKSGYYEIVSELGKVIDIAGGSDASGANARLYTGNKSNAQRFRIERSGNGYKITNFYSSLALFVNNKKSNNVEQGKVSGDYAVWTPEIADGGYINFRNVGSNTLLDVAGGSAANGTNVRGFKDWNPDTNKGQKWKLVSVNPSGWHRNNGRLYYKSDQAGDILITDSGYAAWRAVQSLSSKTKYLLVIDNTNNRVYCFTGSQGKWVPYGDWIAAVGVPPEVGGDETFGETFRGISEVRKKGYVMGWYPYEFYWTEFYINSHALESDGEGQRFHSVLYKNPDKPVDVWDDRLGVACTHGCVRLELDKAKWIYDNIPLGTKVWSY